MFLNQRRMLFAEFGLGSLIACLLAAPLEAGDRQERDSNRIEVTPSQLDAHSGAEQRIIDMANELRVRHGAPPLRVNEQLAQAAHYFAYYMAETGEYGHDADGARPADRAHNYGYEYCIVAENIAYFETAIEPDSEELAERLHQAWVDSPEHRDNLLDPELAEIGVALARSGATGGWYAVQKFGRPRSMQVEFTLNNSTNEQVSYVIAERVYELPAGFSRRHFRCRGGELRLGDEEAVSMQYASGAGYRVVQRGDSLAIEQVDR